MQQKMTIGECRLQMESKLSILLAVELFPVIMFQLIIQFDVNSLFCHFFLLLLSPFTHIMQIEMFAHTGFVVVAQKATIAIVY